MTAGGSGCKLNTAKCARKCGRLRKKCGKKRHRFRRASAGPGAVVPTYRPGVKWSNLWEVLPEFLCQSLAEALPERGVLVAANLLSLAAAYLFIYRGREAVKQVYNREV